VGYHQFYLGVLGLHVVAFGFVLFVGCDCLECSCWGGSSVVCWPTSRMLKYDINFQVGWQMFLGLLYILHNKGTVPGLHN
jgi:hypothetical protein